MSVQYSPSVHVSVMPNEVGSYLRLAQGGRFLDCTLGGGGHTELMLSASPHNSVMAIDRDERALRRAAVRLAAYQDRITLQHASFAELGDVCGTQRFDGMLADLGLSSDQLDENRSFSFADDVQLDMRMDESQALTAHEVVNGYSERELTLLFKRGGVGEATRAIVRAIMKQRPIESARKLADLIMSVTPKRFLNPGFHPATVPFQAIRMEVNQELAQIDQLLNYAPALLNAAGRLAIITFHSGEDKLVAGRMRRWESGDSAPALWRNRRSGPAAVMPSSDLQNRGALVEAGRSVGKFLTKKAVVPSADEISVNSRARSARLRVFEFE